LKTVSSTRRNSAARSPHIAAFLSFLWPGLGHAYSKRRRSAALFAVPAVIVNLILLVEGLRGVGHLAALLITPSSALTILILVVLFGIWRLVAIADSMLGLGVREPWRRGRTAVTFGTLAVIVAVTHLALGYVAWAFYDAGSRIFAGDNGPDQVQSSVPGPGSTGDLAGPAATPAATPQATPETATSRINILLVGADSAEERTTSLTDTLMVVSIDPVSGEVAMISFPRDIANFELPDGTKFKGKINSLMTYAKQHPKQFPDGPLPTVIASLSHLLGSPIHYYAALDLDGFRRMIDLVGGVRVDNPRAINDPQYDWLNSPEYGFKLSAGVHTLDGETALAYVRSRQGVGDSDFTRARRQQQVLLSLRTKLMKPEMVTKLPEILDAAADSISTNFPSERVGEMIDLASRAEGAKVTQVVLGPPYAIHPPSNTTGGVYTLRLDMKRMAKLSIKIFGDQSRYAATP
jgi:LCP family protein required for cell wall assembly